jgi:hypothetical protein
MKCAIQSIEIAIRAQKNERIFDFVETQSGHPSDMGALTGKEEDPGVRECDERTNGNHDDQR